MTSSQCFLLPKVGVEGELISKKSISLKMFDQATAFLFTPYCLAFPKAQSSHGLKVPVTCIPISLVVVQVIDLDVRPPATQLSWVLIQRSRIILPTEDLTMILFQWLLDILFPCESLHIRAKWFASTLGQNFTGHIIWICTVLSIVEHWCKAFHFHRWHVPRATLNQLIDVDDVKKTGIVIWDVIQCTQVFDPCVLCEWKKCCHQRCTTYMPL